MINKQLMLHSLISFLTFQYFCRKLCFYIIVGGVVDGVFGGVVLTSVIAVVIHVLIMRSTKKRISGKKYK